LGILPDSIVAITNETGPRLKYVPDEPVNKISVVIAAGGTGARMGASVPKQFIRIGGRPILVRTIDALFDLDNLALVIIALPEEHIAETEAMLRERTWPIPVICIRGGKTRQQSVHNGVRQVPEDIDLILVHDAVRPFCDAAMLKRVAEAAARIGAAVPALPATETIQRVARNGRILKTPPREELFAIQTPQGFRAGILRSALDRASAEGFEGTDESSVVRWAGHRVMIVPGSPENIKITRPIDLEVAAKLVGELQTNLSTQGHSMMRIGYGIDYHRLVEGRKLILGGVEIPFEKGLEGHSDADALLHAICDAMLGAAALGDIGRHFPDSDPIHRNRASIEFLIEVKTKIAHAGWSVANIDATILAQRPKLAGYFDSMRRNIAQALGLDAGAVNVKATTTEGLNAEGRGEGISAQAVVMLTRA
jgi:2-C-methyl-D-erythritol 4-phosphate cytidylyltransferase/2-C-methyl-D-erythritol 2,4-cyclodiphosphate synthase